MFKRFKNGKEYGKLVCVADHLKQKDRLKQNDEKVDFLKSIFDSLSIPSDPKEKKMPLP